MFFPSIVMLTPKRFQLLAIRRNSASRLIICAVLCPVNFNLRSFIFSPSVWSSTLKPDSNCLPDVQGLQALRAWRLTSDPTGFDFKLCANWIRAQGCPYREYNKLFPNRGAAWHSNFIRNLYMQPEVETTRHS